jgi:predicted nucleotidyltransferase
VTVRKDLPASPRAPDERRRCAEEIIASLIARRPLRVIVFGSWARGRADVYSDLDVVVVEETDKRFLRRLDDWDFVPQMGCDVLVYTPEEFASMQARGNAFIQNIVREGITVYARPERMATLDQAG